MNRGGGALNTIERMRSSLPMDAKVIFRVSFHSKRQKWEMIW